MTLPAALDPCWTRLAEGGLVRLKTQHLGAQLMTKRLERSNDPVSIKAIEIRTFFTKWERALDAEIQQLTTL